MESTEIGTSNVRCVRNRSLFSVPNMPNAEHESSFVVCHSRGSSVISNSSAPIYSFDEDGDILPRVIPFTPHNSVESEYDNTSLALVDNERLSGFDNHKEKSRDNKQLERKNLTTKEDFSPTLSSSRRRKIAMIKYGASEGSEGDPQPSNDETYSPEGLIAPPQPPPQVNIVLETSPIPKIDFQTPSIEVVDDYLESHLGGECDSQLKDLCSSLLGESGFPGHHVRSSQGSCVSLLTATPQDTGPKRQRVPFDTVVFTERKPSTGDALIQSLGLSAYGADSIQDIASKNQGAARERLQLAEGGQVEVAGLRSHCESCGVSPEDCLKKLGLQSDRERVLSPSPKSEKLWQLFQQIQAGLLRFPRNRKTSGSEPELDQEPIHKKVAPTKSKSLDTSPMHSSFDDIRKPMMNTV